MTDRAVEVDFFVSWPERRTLEFVLVLAGLVPATGELCNSAICGRLYTWFEDRDKYWCMQHRESMTVLLPMLAGLCVQKEVRVFNWVPRSGFLMPRFLL